MSRLIPAVVCCALVAGCGGGQLVPDTPPASANRVSLQPQEWHIMHSQGMSGHPSLPSGAGGAWSIRLPDRPNSLHYVQTPFRSTLTLHRVLITFRVESSANANYNGKVDPAAWDPATFHIFLQRRGDDLRKEHYRWWASKGVYVLGSRDNTVVTIEVPLDYREWTNVQGHTNETEFNNTLNDLGWVGLTFGGSNFFGHGVNMNAGQASFVLLDYRID